MSETMMDKTMMNKTAIEKMLGVFMDAFDRDDLDAVMDAFTPDIVYVEYDGTRSEGQEAVRKAFGPQFRGDFGTIRFHSEDQFIDAESRRALIRWQCVIDKGGVKLAWDGLDIFHFEGEKISEKHTYAKASKLELEKLA